jgi:hypothetical protein
MNKSNILLFVTILLFQQFAIAQTKTEKGVESVLDALSSGTDNFEGLSDKLNMLKKGAMADFETEQAAIDAEQARIDRNEAEINKDKHREAQMMYDEWKERSKAISKLRMDKEQLHQKKLALSMRKVQFKDQITQAEQKMVSTLANQIEEQMRSHNNRMKKLKEQLEEVEF